MQQKACGISKDTGSELAAKRSSHGSDGLPTLPLEQHDSKTKNDIGILAAS